jgi:hypothetical protein
MKLEFLILSIFLITSVIDSTDIDTNSMISNSEQTFYSLKAGNKYYFTVYAYYNHEYTFRIKMKNYYYSSYFSLSYIGHIFSTPSTFNKAEGSLNLHTSTSTYITSFNIYESSSYKVTDSSINYLTFVLTPSKDIESVSIKILESKASSNNEVIFIIVFFSIFVFCVIFCIIFVFCKACCECLKPKPTVQPVPQPNYTPLTPQYQQPQPIQPQPQPQYMAPPQYNQPNQYVQPPQYINPQQNINGYAPGQLYASS